MTTLLFSHPICLEHSNFPGHPEQPERLRVIDGGLENPAFFLLDRREAPEGDVRDIKRVHAPYYVESILESVPKEGYVALDPDTGLCPASGQAALRAVGAACAAVDAVVAGEARNAFCAIRPPGHHAEAAQAMGFCLFNNAAVAARHGRAACGLERVAVVDFDVHHGNGTQSAFEEDPTLFYASSHQWPAFPGTGMEHETGVGNIVNVPLAPGSGSDEFRQGYIQRILPELRKFRPDLLIISAGFDAHARDPLAQLRLQTEDFAWVTRELLTVADECCRGRVVSVLEGGYDLSALTASVAVHVRELMGI
ncbi:histone deacetylase family protein [Shumkonia mesophila]|uniref:histone deacetylase family protein n=1 Tax=Shumkonia mesophila TaxID=2838854 RepID=UPI002934C892|nr:histone deacetylase family protein [Shumkonia mesophila]